MAVRVRRQVKWHNWGRNVRSVVDRYCEVSSVAEIQSIVRQARAEGAKVRVVGDAHSWSPLCASTDYLISAKRMNRILDVTSNPPRITVEPGVTVADTLRAYKRHGVVLPSNVDVPPITIAGAVAVGANGFSKRWGTYSQFVYEVELVTGTGEVRTINRDREPELMRSVACSLGLFGIMTRITLDLEPMFNVRVINRKLPVRQAIEDCWRVFGEHEYAQYFWFPYNDTLMLQVADRSTEASTWTRKHDVKKFAVGWGQTVGTYLLDPLLRAVPRLTPTMTKIAFKSLPETDQVMLQSDNVLLGGYIDSMRPCQNCSVSFPPGPDGESVKRAWWMATELIDTMQADGKYPANLEMNMRLFGPSTSLLDSLPGQSSDALTCNIQITGFVNKHWTEFSVALMQRWMTIPGARPHWAKQFQNVPGIIPQIHTVFGDHLPAFAEALRTHGNDPDHLFVNPFLEQLLPN